jgi:hypothetical protein
MRYRAKTEIVSTEVVRPARCQIHFHLKDLWRNGRDNSLCHLVLQRKHVSQVTFKSIGPKVRAACGINQLAGDA